MQSAFGSRTGLYEYFQMQTSESQVNSPAALEQLKFKKVTEAYYLERFKEDFNEGNYITNQTLKAVFDILLKLSYGLFALGVVLTIKSGAINQQSAIAYIQTTRNQILLVVLIVLGVLILSLLRIVKQESKITAKTKKYYNFAVDIIRTIFYIIAIIFAGPFVFENNNGALTVSFWVFLVALLLFIGRKISKWVYFMFDPKGKLILTPWQAKDLTSKENLSKFADFIEFMMKKSLSGENKQEETARTPKTQSLKKLHGLFLNNLEEKSKLMAEMEKIFN